MIWSPYLAFSNKFLVFFCFFNCSLPSPFSKPTNSHDLVVWRVCFFRWLGNTDTTSSISVGKEKLLDLFHERKYKCWPIWTLCFTRKLCGFLGAENCCKAIDAVLVTVEERISSFFLGCFHREKIRVVIILYLMKCFLSTVSSKIYYIDLCCHSTCEMSNENISQNNPKNNVVSSEENQENLSFCTWGQERKQEKQKENTKPHCWCCTILMGWYWLFIGSLRIGLKQLSYDVIFEGFKKVRFFFE